ncbi:MAG: 6-phosphogluconolactonase [Caulobacter sp.]|nr:6-phosphogluconolactonase [Caulobacter sp.]
MIPVETLATPAAIGERLARDILAGLDRAGKAGGRFVLGCPAGRTPLPVYRALAEAARTRDLARLHLILMDEFVEDDGGTWRRVPASAHHSCAGFAVRHLLDPLPGIPRANLHVPDPRAPGDYEALIGDLGGIDLFLLASGATDGHVAFNPPATSLQSNTRIVALAKETREDNLSTFPSFASLGDVPTHGVSIGLGTIVRHSRAAVMMLHGSHKGSALARLRQAEGFCEAWPASVIFACRNPRIIVDQAAALAAEVVAVVERPAGRSGIPQAHCQDT